MHAFAPPPRLTISEWADAKRYLSPESSAEPGKWRTARAEYQRGVMDAICDPAIGKVVCIKGSQVGWTEILNNACGYFIDQDPCSLLVIQPTIDLAEVWSKDRLAPMLRDTPALRGRVQEARSRTTGNTILGKVFPGGRLAIIGANAPSQLASRPIRVVLADEVDRYPVSAGTEGDPLSLAAKRQTTFWNRKTLVGSTPVLKATSVINREWEASDQRRYFVPCHACGEAQHLQWSQVRWDKDEKGEHMPDTAHYVCEHCGAIWDDIDRFDAAQRGEWRATAVSPAGVAGFHIPGLLSPWLTMQDIVREFLAARHDPALLQVWTNTVLGEVWEEPAEKVEGSALLTRGENYSPATVPAGVRLVTVGVDVQGDRLEAQWWGWGVNEESWALRYEVIHGDPAQKQVWDDLDALLLERLTTDDGRELRVRAACVDTGGHHANAVFDFTNKRRARRIFPIKGRAGPYPVWPKRVSKTKDKRNEVFLVGVDTGKDTIYGRLRITRPGPGYIHFPAGQGFDADYFDQLTAEQVVTRKKEGKPYRVWVLPEKKRNEALDTYVYALAARASIPIRLVGPPPLAPEVPATSRQAPPPPAGPSPARPKKGDSQLPRPDVMSAPRKGQRRRLFRSLFMGR
jgi:phage terminase large subunit GpA-like protein